MGTDKWADDTIQFPRLLAEIRAIGLTSVQYAELGESMDLQRGEIDELLERAETAWQGLKNTPAMTRAAPLWVREFGVGYAIPDLVTKDPALEDVSWHNDICPSFVLVGVTNEDDQYTHRLWIEHPDRACREHDDEGQFVVHGVDADTPLYIGDDLAEAIRILKATKEGA